MKIGHRHFKTFRTLIQEIIPHQTNIKKILIYFIRGKIYDSIKKLQNM